MEKNLANRAKAPSAKQAAAGAHYLRLVMEDAFPDAMVEHRAYQPFIGKMTNDPKDRHVLAAAVVGRADVIVTANVMDFPPEACEPCGIEVQDPDTFLCHQFELTPLPFMETLVFLSTERREPMNSVEGILSALHKAAPKFCAMAELFQKGQMG